MRSTVADSDAFKHTEQRLYEWGSERGRAATLLGIASSSTIATVIEILRAQEIQRRRQAKLDKKLKQARKKKLVSLRRKPRPCDVCGHIHARLICPRCPRDPKVVALELGNADPTLTANGKQSMVVIAPDELVLSSNAVSVEQIVVGLAGWMKSCIFRTYAYHQPDRIAARELRMTREEYTRQREASVEHVMEKLAERKCAAV
jgi:hypothetical protein